MSAKITFYGGAGSVTGANFLLDTGSTKILIDCGSYEQERTCDPESAKPFPYDVSAIDALIVTHAHQDHIGRIPKLMREGFRGVIYSTPPTKDLSQVMLEDALSVMGEEAARENCEPLYTREDLERAFSDWRTSPYHQVFEIGGVSVELLDAGHVLGSAMVKFSRNGRSVIFTGDLGNSPEPLLNDTESPEGANYLVVESVYGDRVHEDRLARQSVLKEAVNDTAAKKGILLIPSFSLERTQILLYELHTMLEQKKIPTIPVYLDAPLAIRVTDIFRRYPMYFNDTIREILERGQDPFSFRGLTLTEVSARSHEIEHAPNPKVIIAGAGMSGGGRVRQHEARYLSDKNAGVLFVGYQAPGTLGRRIEDGAKEVVIDRQHVVVRAAIKTLTGYSGHKDRDGLLEFAESARATLEKVFVVMGEPSASMYLAQQMKDFVGLSASVPKRGDVVEINL